MDVRLSGKRVTVLPMVADDAKVQEEALRFAEALGIFLERAGAKADVRNRPVAVAAGDTPKEVSERLKEVISAGESVEGYTLLVALEGMGKLRRARLWLANEKGDTALRVDRSEFPEGAPENPMQALLLVVNVLREYSDLKDPLREDAPKGEMAERVRERSGLPTKDEIEAMEKRAGEAGKRIGKMSLAVHPFHIRGQDEESAEAATALSSRIAKEGIARIMVLAEPVKLGIEGDPNQMKMMWDSARAFRAELKENPPQADYALYVSTGPMPDVRLLHLVMCDRAGEWVMADLQNSHHGDFAAISPDSVEDCVELAMRRLKKWAADHGEAQ